MEEATRLKVFLSWSGQRSEAVAHALHRWLPEIFDNVQPFMSQSDIGPGQRGLREIEDTLAGTSFGIIVVTSENQDRPWINFEAGALSKAITTESETRVIPLLVDMSTSDLARGPLTQFQARQLDKPGLLDIVQHIVRVVHADEGPVTRRFERSWDELQDTLSAAVQSTSGRAGDANPRRSQHEILEEVLDISRGLRRDMHRYRRESNEARHGSHTLNSVHYATNGVWELANELGLNVTGIDGSTDGLRVYIETNDVPRNLLHRFVSLAGKRFGVDVVIVNEAFVPPAAFEN